MNILSMLGRISITAATLSLLFCLSLRAQERPSSAEMQTEAPGSASGPTSARESERWHFDLSPYLWFAGARGTIGARGRDTSFHATPGDLLSHVDLGLMGSAEARHKRFLLTGDLLWIRISDSHALPFPGLGAVSADVRVGELVWTSKLGYRVIERKKVKADANVGARYWHLGQKLNFSPSPLGLSFTSSQNWADIVIGGRVQLPMGQKIVIDVLGDVGGWNATAKLDYQFATLLRYELSPKWMVGVGYRYLFVDYRGNNAAVFNVVTSGALVGVTYRLK